MPAGPLNITSAAFLIPSLRGEELRPQRAPLSCKRNEVRRFLVMASRTIGGFDPRLRALQEDMRDRRQPFGVVERAGTDVDGVRPHLARAVDARTAVAAEP